MRDEGPVHEAMAMPSGGLRMGGGVLACADWFAGKCEGDPLEVAPSSVGDVRPLSLGTEEDERFSYWVGTRLRELWPLERSA